MIWSETFAPYGRGRLSEPGGLEDAALGTRLAAYRRQVARRYRVFEPEEIESQLPRGNLWISTKLDGELWFLVKRGGEVALCASNGRVLAGVPALAEADARLQGVESIVIAGELVAALPETDGRPRSFHVSRALGDPALAHHLSFHAFDLVEEAGRDVADGPYGERLARIRQLLGEGPGVRVVTTEEGPAAAAAVLYREWVSIQGFEGIVVRSEQGLVYKIKPTFTLDAVVVAFGERLVAGVAQLRELELALRRDDGSLQVLGSVGGGFGDRDRVAWREKLHALVVPSSFRLANREGTLCRFVDPRVVVEVRCNDLVDTDGNDVPITRMALRYEAATGYAAIGPMPIPSMIFPRFVRERPDKASDVASVGLDQIYSRLPFDSRFETPSAAARAEPVVLRRGVYVKGSTAVRKYVAIATNRPHDPDYPRFVVHFTDFSAGRAEPLKASLRVASTTESLDRHIAAWIEENVKRGWSELGAAGAEAPQPKAGRQPAKPRARRARGGS
jgi:hypothetical protein